MFTPPVGGGDIYVEVDYDRFGLGNVVILDKRYPLPSLLLP